MELPDPSGGPVPVKASKLSGALKQGAIAVVSGGLLLLVVAAIATPTMGGRRSTRLKWQEQQRQAQDAVDKGNHVSASSTATHD